MICEYSFIDLRPDQIQRLDIVIFLSSLKRAEELLWGFCIFFISHLRKHKPLMLFDLNVSIQNSCDNVKNEPTVFPRQLVHKNRESVIAFRYDTDLMRDWFIQNPYVKFLRGYTIWQTGRDLITQYRVEMRRYTFSYCKSVKYTNIFTPSRRA